MELICCSPRSVLSRSSPQTLFPSMLIAAWQEKYTQVRKERTQNYGPVTAQKQVNQLIFITKEIRNKYQKYQVYSVTGKAVFGNAMCFQIAPMHLSWLLIVTESQRRVEMCSQHWLDPLQRSENTMMAAGTLVSLDVCSLRDTSCCKPHFLQTYSGTNGNMF